MENRDKILGVLAKLAGKGICDDCLTEMSSVHPRQQVYQIVSRLAKGGLIKRGESDCAIRCVGIVHGPKTKLLSYLADSRPTAKKPPTLGAQTDSLSQWLFEAEQFLNRIESVASSKEFFAARVARFKGEDKISKPLSAQMQLLNTYRVQVVKNRLALDFEDWTIAIQSMEKTRSDWQKALLRK